MKNSDDTIAAIATAPGRGAVAMIRMSGPRAFEIATALGAPEGVIIRSAVRCILRDAASGETLDDLLATRFLAPNSFTGEDVVELSTHGGRLVPQAVLAACLRAGARHALPGEFTRRALLNGRMDLLQAEAIADLVDARTGAMHRQALAQLDGGLSRRLMALRADIITLEVLLAYDIDFPEEDDGPVAPERVARATGALREQLAGLLATAPRAALVRDGALVVIAGPPNAGKSSLFNALLGEARALVTEIPGTTRDAIEALLDTPGLPLRLVDTAGLRTTDDVVERLGIEVSERYLAGAHLVLACSENAAGLLTTVARVSPLTTAPVLGVLTKADTRENIAADVAETVAAVNAANDATGVNAANDTTGVNAANDATGVNAPNDTTGVNAADDSTALLPRHAPVTVLPASAETGAGLGPLLQAIIARLTETGGYEPADDATPLTRERHRIALARALEEVVAFEEAWIVDEVPATIAAVHLRAAVYVLDELVGSISVDDILDKLFRDFCVGK